jgi:hypothetical protein
MLTKVNFKNPDYDAIFRQRIRALEWLRANPEQLPALRAYYKENLADFISDWGVTFEPRNAEIRRPTIIPFVLFPKQREWVDFVIRKWRERLPGLGEKSRDMGITWTSVGTACGLCIFNEGVAIGFGSRKEEYVDKIGTMKPILPKARMFMEHLPEEFRAGWVSWRDAPYMRLTFPDTGSIIAGEAGAQIGRGDRTSIYLVDEAAHLEQPELVDMALSQTTNCRIDMSSVNGMNNPFAQKRWGGKIEVFIFDWRDDPRKDDAWYAKQTEVLDPVVVAQEIDRDYSASVHGIVIPGPWVRAAIGARQKLGIAPSGVRWLSLDVADEGLDKNAAIGGRGIEVTSLEQWSGKGSDIYATVERAFELCDDFEIEEFRYDSDGLGAGVRGDARTINQWRRENGAKVIRAVGFRGSDKVHDPEGIVEGTKGGEGDKGRTNKDYFFNRKSQGWWAVRRRFQKTYRWVVEGIACEPDDLISLDPKMPLLHKLVAELSQPTYAPNGVGKIVINKKPDGMPSPNLADGVMIRFAPIEAPPFVVTQQMVAQIQQVGMMARRRRY